MELSTSCVSLPLSHEWRGVVTLYLYELEVAPWIQVLSSSTTWSNCHKMHGGDVSKLCLFAWQLVEAVEGNGGRPSPLVGSLLAPSWVDLWRIGHLITSISWCVGHPIHVLWTWVVQRKHNLHPRARNAWECVSLIHTGLGVVGPS
jgi:hypothetical protein